MKYLRWSIPAVALLFLSGCFQIAEVMHLNPDGSGTVEETMMLSKTFFTQMSQMMGGSPGDQGANAESMDLYDPAKLQEQAKSMGEGVSYVSGKKIETADFTGYTAVYAFQDINKLNFDLQGSALGAPAGGGQTPQMIRFHFTRSTPGSPATLIIEQPSEKKTTTTQPATESPSATAPAQEGTTSDAETAKLMNMFKGMKFAMAIDINGAIVSTNATYRDGSRITLFDFDMEKLGNSAKDMEKLSGLKTGSFDEAKEMLKDIPGMKFDMNEKLTVVFSK